MNRYLIDPRHPRPGETPPARSGPANEQAPPAARSGPDESRVAAERRTPRLRIDAAAGHRPAAHTHASAEPPTFSAQMFRLHESLAPHMGLVGAAALGIAGTFLYWLAFAQSGMVVHPGELLQISTDVPHESAPLDVSPNAEPDAPAVTKAPRDDAGWSVPPRVAAAAPAASDSPAAELRGDKTLKVEPALIPPAEVPVPLPPVEDDLPTTTMRQRVITPTPNATHPTTPYPAYWFGSGVAGTPAPGPAAADQASRLGIPYNTSR